MTPNARTLAAPPAADVTTLLPSRDALLAHLGERLPLTVRTSATLMVVGLLRRDDGWPTAQSTLTEVTTLLARSLRGGDYLAKSGPGEFAVVLSGSVETAAVAAERLVASVAVLGIPGLTAAAGVTALAPELTVARGAAPRAGEPDRRTAGRGRHGHPLPRAVLIGPVSGRGARTAAAIRSSVAVSARRTCRAPAGP